MNHKFCFIDFEFNLHCKTPRLICCVLRWKGVFSNIEDKYWLRNNANEEDRLNTTIRRLDGANFIFVCFTDAEPKCFYGLGRSPLWYKWIDAQILGYPFYHSSAEFGNYAQDNYFPDEGWWNDEALESDSDQEEVSDYKSVRKKAASLLGFYEFFCKEDISKEKTEKELTRKLIINLQPNDIIPANVQQEILDYCASDVEVLEKLFYAQIKKWAEVAKTDENTIVDRWLNFTKFRVQMCDVSQHGVPLNRAVYEDLVKTYAERIKKEQAALWRFYRHEEAQTYKVGIKKGTEKCPEKYTQDHNKFVQVIASHSLESTWPRTPTGRFSSDEKVLQQFQIIPEIKEFWLGRKRIKHIEFFKPDEKGIPKIARFVTESDGMLWQHPEFGTFGTNTSRNAHKTSTFIMGMERNLRKTLLGCPDGYIVLQPDFSAQEVWIAGALSGDQNQLRAAFEDPYLFFGVQAGMIPIDGNKYTYERERDICKTVVLAAFYGMGFQSLKNKLQLPSEQVKHLQHKNQQLYATYFKWRDNFLNTHRASHYYELMDGWPLLHNQKPNGEYKVCPAMNFPIQGHGAVIMRKAVNDFYENKQYLASEKVRLIYTLHDEFGVLCPKDSEQEVKSFMRDIMQGACRHYFPTLEPPRVGFK